MQSAFGRDQCHAENSKENEGQGRPGIGSSAREYSQEHGSTATTPSKKQKRGKASREACAINRQFIPPKRQSEGLTFNIARLYQDYLEDRRELMGGIETDGVIQSFKTIIESRSEPKSKCYPIMVITPFLFL